MCSTMPVAGSNFTVFPNFLLRVITLSLVVTLCVVGFSENPIPVGIDNKYCSKPFSLEGQNLEYQGRTLADLLNILKKGYKSLYSYDGLAVPHEVLGQKVSFCVPGNEDELMSIVPETDETEKSRQRVFALVNPYKGTNSFLQFISYPLLVSSTLDELIEVIVERPLFVVHVTDWDNTDEENIKGEVGYTFEAFAPIHFAQNGQIRFVFRKEGENDVVFCSEVKIHEMNEVFEKHSRFLHLPLPLPDESTDYSSESPADFSNFTLVRLIELGQGYNWSNLATQVRKEIGIDNGINLMSSEEFCEKASQGEIE